MRSINFKAHPRRAAGEEQITNTSDNADSTTSASAVNNVVKIRLSFGRNAPGSCQHCRDCGVSVDLSAVLQKGCPKRLGYDQAHGRFAATLADEFEDGEEATP